MLIAHNLSKTYAGGETPVPALRDVSFSVPAGECIALVGPSGCGKSTLLHLCGAMDRATSGRLVFEGRDLAALDDEALTLVRRDRVGFVFQFFNLLPTLTLADNIMLPALLSGSSEREAAAWASALAERVGIAHRLGHYPQQVSGGELQRAAIARALVHRPALLIADEPTGNLDSAMSLEIMTLLSGLNTERGITIIMVTHEPDMARFAKRIVNFRDGRIEQAGHAKEMVG